MAAKKMANIPALEKYFEKCRKAGMDMAWRITETPDWYNIQAEDDGKELAYYQTGNWPEIVAFCGSHCNPGYDTLDGLGCTEQELADATVEYHSIGGKYRYE